MELTTVKVCFKKYMSFLEKSERIRSPEQYDLDTMTIQDIDKLTQITFMDYVSKCDDKVNQFSVACTLYRHVNSLIRQYIQDEANKTIEKLNDIIFKLEDENGKLKKEIMQKSAQTNMSAQPVKGWFFN
jgi:hypothetical protein